MTRILSTWSEIISSSQSDMEPNFYPIESTAELSDDAGLTASKFHLTAVKNCETVQAYRFKKTNKFIDQYRILESETRALKRYKGASSKLKIRRSGVGFPCYFR